MSRRYALIGDPVAHSLSPLMHTHWLAQAGIDAVYSAMQVAAAKVQSIKNAGLAGANVTVPHKAAAAELADRRDAIAEALGAANVLRWEADGSVSAFNTDVAGFMASLAEAFPEQKIKQALILGAGGAALAVGYGLRQNGAEVAIANRTIERAAAAAEKLDAQCVEGEHLHEKAAQADLIVHAVSAGLKGEGGGFEGVLDFAPEGAIAADLTYRPLKTAFLQSAERRGLAILDGLGMLLHQGALSFELWFDQRPDIGSARALLLAALEGEG